MRVVIDVHSLGTQAGGNETFYRQLLEGLAENTAQNEYLLLHTELKAPSLVKLDSRFTWKQISANPIRRICISIPWLLRRLRPDVFHCQYILPPNVKCRSVITIHDLAHETYPQFSPRMEALRMRTLVPWSARRADHIVTVSQYSAAEIERLYRVSRNKISVAYQAPPGRFQPRDKQPSKQLLLQKYGIADPFILYVGRLQARKNLSRLIRAYAKVRANHPAIKLVMVGKPDLQYQDVLATVRELNLQDDVIFPGYIAHDDLPLFYNAAEVFVFPSIFEGFGLPVMESLASGVPTITSNGSCLGEIAADGALLVDPLNADQIAEAITRVLSDAALRSELIQRGLLRSSCFSTASFTARILEAYEAAASGSEIMRE
jgi:glycosyltransferase involved in cell wall biosynthesis